MDTFAKRCAIRHVFFNDFGLDRTFLLSDLSALYLYYADENTPAEIKYIYNQISAWLMKIELIRKFYRGEPAPIPKDFNCTVSAAPGSDFPLFKFSPEIKLPADNRQVLPVAQINGLISEFSQINVAAMAEYVRKRIYEKGDFDFVEKDMTDEDYYAYPDHTDEMGDGDE